MSVLLATSKVFALTNDAQLISITVPAGTQMMPRTVFTQTWTLKNTGTNSWTPGRKGYTLNMVGTDTLGAVPLTTNTIASAYHPAAAVNSGKSVAPGATGTYTMSFIVPETPGSYTDTFQLNSTNSLFFGPQVTIQITVINAGSTNQFDRSRVVSYANNFAGYVVTDGNFWTNSSVADITFLGAGAPVPTAELGDDCAHFVSSCLGRQPGNWGGGLPIPTRVSPSYGEPGVGRLINTCLLAPGYAVEVPALTNLSPGDLIGWNWEGDTNIANLDHATLYLGNGLLASHSESCLDVAPSFFQNSLPNWRWHLIHILDSPTLNSSVVGTNLVLSWGTNWAGYSLYSSTSTVPGAAWTKVTKSPVKVGALNKMTNSMSSTSVFYRLVLP